MTGTPTRPAPPPRPKPAATRPDAPREPVVDHHRHRVVLWTLAAVTVVVAVAGALAYSPLLDVERVDVVGAPPERIDEVRAASGIRVGDPILTFLPGRAAARVDGLPWVARASVSRRLPSHVTITVVARTAVGFVRAGTRFALVDRTGRVLSRAAQAPGGVPELVGVADVAAPGGSVRPVDLARAAGALGPQLRIRAATVTIHDATLTVQVVGGPEIRFGAVRDVAMKARVAAAVLASLGGAPVQYIDVTVPAAPVSA